ncbi:MAG: hypothetical protein M1827_002229 [Pycnora praestabilis]|nr:MAG: hypothetical protein M1827_002229 [Pycnora praestabilis]
MDYIVDEELINEFLRIETPTLLASGFPLNENWPSLDSSLDPIPNENLEGYGKPSLPLDGQYIATTDGCLQLWDLFGEEFYNEASLFSSNAFHLSEADNHISSLSQASSQSNDSDADLPELCPIPQPSHEEGYHQNSDNALDVPLEASTVEPDAGPMNDEAHQEVIMWKNITPRPLPQVPRHPFILPKPGQHSPCFRFAEDIVLGKRTRGSFTDDDRTKVREVRKKGACVRCRILRKKCDLGDPCGSCLERNPRIWHEPCLRTNLKDLVLYTSDEWGALLESLTEKAMPETWTDDEYCLVIKGGTWGPKLEFKMRGIGGTNAPQLVGPNTLSKFALPSKKDKPSISIKEFDAYVDGLIPNLPQKIFVTFLAQLLKATIDYAEETENELVRLALRYYAYCRLTHGFLRGLCYEGYNGGVGCGVWLRELFHWNEVSVAFKAQLLRFLTSRTRVLEIKLFTTIEAQLGAPKKEQSFTPVLLALSVLVDQLDCNVHEGRWLTMPAVNLVCPRKTALVSDAPTERLGVALTNRATALAAIVLRFSRLISERTVPSEASVKSKKRPFKPDQQFLLKLRNKLRGPRSLTDLVCL